ncbi:hypothetical protein N7532_002291 [Penicillium argentinense]|uniref:CoA transferase n=1 Tax=Penicillium argentinense TaxID=1131581 RepID=A0A9W9G029_9EURO|nr:uncharacterized protein N7532_002291 [Penicillium argentinense]KAJ5109646.1 hypothetical protein N7532_002291 [Penicillium argentinense]
MYDTQIGKRDAELDLKSVERKLAFCALFGDADVVLDGFRPGALERLGFGFGFVQSLAVRRGKGVVYARENTYGVAVFCHFVCLVLAGKVKGVSWAQGKFLGLDEPVVPLLPNSDYQTGIVGAIAITHALYRRAHEGGSYNVDTSLNQFNNWYLDLGLQDPDTAATIKAKDPDFMV